jgi:proline iminopeptidase
MMASIPAYNRYAEEVLMPTMNQAALAEIKRLEASGQTQDQRYMELLMEHITSTTFFACRRMSGRTRW